MYSAKKIADPFVGAGAEVEQIDMPRALHFQNCLGGKASS